MQSGFDGEWRAVLEKEFVDLKIGGGAFPGRDQDLDAGQRGHALTEDMANDPWIDLAVERFGEQLGIVLFQGAGFLFLKAGAVTAIPAEGAQIGAAPEGGNHAIHALNEAGKRNAAAGAEVDHLHVIRG